jgi:hypothetical protein
MAKSVNLEDGRISFSADIKGGATEAQIATAERLFKKLKRDTEILAYMLACVEKVEGGGAESVTLSYIDSVVKNQMELNRVTQKTIMVGSGKSETSVKFEQRAITPKWIMDRTLSNSQAGIEGARSVNLDAATEYLKLHPDVLQHNQWLCTSNGVEPTDSNIQNFNRRTGKAAARSIKEGVA